MKTFKRGETPQPSAQPLQQQSSNDAQQQPTSTGRSVAAKGNVVQLQYEDLDMTARYQEPFALAVYGAQGSGKTRIGTTAPGKIGVVPLNRKTRQTVVKTAQELGKRIKMPTFDLVRSSNPMKSAMLPPKCDRNVEIDIYRDQPWCCAVHNGRWAADRAKQCALDLAADPSIDSVLIDGFDILCEDIFIGLYGRSERVQPRDRGPYNKEMIELLGALSGKHLVLTMGEKQVWKNDKPTNDYDWAGWNHMGYHCSSIVRTTVQENYDPDKHDHRWALSVVLSQANPELMGIPGQDLLTDEDISFPQLAIRIYPGTEIEDWE